MIQKNLTDLLLDTASAAGYEPCLGLGHRLEPAIGVLPAAWFEPPKLVEQHGRRECRGVYRISMRLLCLPREVDRNDIWAQLEQDARKICGLLTANDLVLAVENLRIACAENSLTSRGELSVEATFEIIAVYPCDFL